MPGSAPVPDEQFVQSVCRGLSALGKEPARTFVNPPQCPRRASVALLLRFRPHPDDLAALASHTQSYSSLYPAGVVPLISSEAARMRNVWSGRLSPVAEAEEVSSSATTNGPSAPPSNDSDASDDDSTSPEDDPPATKEQGPGPGPEPESPVSRPTPPERMSVSTFLAQDWIRRSEPEVFYIQRATRPGDRWSAHVAFPGGKREPEDRSDLYAAMRETWEEAGIDLAEDDFSLAGRLDDREISGAFGSRLLMILASFIFVQTTPFSPEPQLQADEVASAHWIPLRLLVDQAAVITKASVNGGAAPVPVPAAVLGRRRWSSTINSSRSTLRAGILEDQVKAWEEHPYRLTIDIASRLVSSPTLQPIARALIGEMNFFYVPIPNRPVVTADAERDPYDPPDLDQALRPRSKSKSRLTRSHHPPPLPPLQLWGITLGMTLDFLDRLFPEHDTEHAEHAVDLEESEDESEDDGGSSRSSRSIDTRCSRSLPPLRPPLRTRTTDGALWPWGSLWSFARQVRRRMLARTAVPTPRFNATAMRSIVPSFNALDINFYIWLFSGRYHCTLVARQRTLHTSQGQTKNWVSISVAAYYFAVRQALVATLCTRSIAVLTLVVLLSKLVRRVVLRRALGTR